MGDFEFNEASKFKTAEESPGFLFWRVSTSWRRSIETALKPLGLTHPQFVVLATIGYLTRGNRSVTQREIGGHAGLDANTTSQILKGLSVKGLVERRAIDDRSKSSLLTKSGKGMLAKALPLVEGADSLFFRVIDLHSESLMTALRKLAGENEKV